MKASLAVCILAALLAVGSCLQCEVCTAQGNSCTGPMQTCASGQDTCGILLTELMLVGVETQTIIKACATSSDCKVGSNSVNFGTGMTMRMSSACCVGEACRTASVTVPPDDTKPNGVHCPGCFAWSSEQCQDETVDCMGAETHCIDAAVTVQSARGVELLPDNCLLPPKEAGGYPEQVVMKGCASESVCTQLNVSSSAYAGMSANLTKVECRVSSSTGGVAPGAARLLLPALAGLLLLKLLS